MEMNKEFQDYKKYKWFFTSSGKLVVGGKNAVQNDSLLEKVKSSNENFLVMHTLLPGSPFSVILSDINKIKSEEKEECAVFTACFSQLWKSGAKNAKVHSFESNKLQKFKGMKAGTWSVSERIDEFNVSLNLVLTKQKGILRAVPENTVKNKKDILLKVAPGKIDKLIMLPKLIIELEEKFTEAEILSALPAGGIRIIK